MLRLVGLRYKGKVGVLEERRGRQRRTVSDVNILEIRTKFKLHPIKTAFSKRRMKFALNVNSSLSQMQRLVLTI